MPGGRPRAHKEPLPPARCLHRRAPPREGTTHATPTGHVTCAPSRRSSCRSTREARSPATEHRLLPLLLQLPLARQRPAIACRGRETLSRTAHPLRQRSDVVGVCLQFFFFLFKELYLGCRTENNSESGLLGKTRTWRQDLRTSDAVMRMVVPAARHWR
ncbi:hypothetical protein NDU88_001670 [Pleurodeles waltl]|uniref:Uncharacterized protein n=1 Tax=Pleurodeles waltl TaxID=8319 RepID=A0AAV7V8G3_PLEWA|nr:hypothetical protein NDU88_001670 [Pleurodeles waltl]